MEIQTFTELQLNSSTISNEQVQQLEKIVADYPYFQSAQALLAKGLKQNNNYKYNKALKTTAAVTVDRSVLFDYISNFELSTTASTKKDDIAISENKKTNKEENNLQIGAPLHFAKSEAYSFNQWLQLTNKKPIVREIKKDSSLFKNKDLIDSFIDKNPTIKPISKESHPQFQIENSYPEKELMTETLAKVYLEQKKYSNAIKAYDILILKYPEKSGFFADQIKKIEHLKNK